MISIGIVCQQNEEYKKDVNKHNSSFVSANIFSIHIWRVYKSENESIYE
jgi:hypothetical protein